MATYYAQRKSIKNGETQPINNRFGAMADMERQYHLYCASAATNADCFEVDALNGEPSSRARWSARSGRTRCSRNPNLNSRRKLRRSKSCLRYKYKSLAPKTLTISA